MNYNQKLGKKVLADDLRMLVQYIKDTKDMNPDIFSKEERSEMLCSVVFKENSLNNFQRLLSHLCEKLDMEPVSIQQKYRNQINLIKTQYNKATTKSERTEHVTSVKLEEKELERLIRGVEILLSEDFLFASKEILEATRIFFDNISLKLAQSSDIINQNEIIVEHITLPCLLEKVLESSDFSFSKKFIIYTYDFYMSSTNLMLYLIYKYFTPRPEDMTHEEYRHLHNTYIKFKKLRILKLIIFWLEERSLDFIWKPDLIYILDTFLEIKEIYEEYNSESEIVNLLNNIYNMNESIIRSQSKHMKKASIQLLSPNHKNDSLLERLAVRAKSFSKRKTSAVSSPSFYMQLNQASLLLDQTDEFILNANSADSTQKFASVNIKSENKLLEGKTEKDANKGLFERMFLRHNELSEKQQQKQRSLDLSLYSDEVIAKQLTLIDCKEFSKINVREMINKRWLRKDKSKPCTYRAYVARFNHFSCWLQYIVLQCKEEKERIALVERFLNVARLCIDRYRNYNTPHYIFAAIVSLKNFDVITLKDGLKVQYDSLKEIYASEENSAKLYEKTFRKLETPAIPNLTLYLRIFLRLQEGVVFSVKLPYSRNKYLKFPTLIHVQDYCTEMRRFQKTDYSDIIERDDVLYKYLKRDFRQEMDMNLDNSQEVIDRLSGMAKDTKQMKFKDLIMFGLNKTKAKK